MRKKLQLFNISLVGLLCLSNIFYTKICHAQQTGTEQLVAKNIYKGDFTVAGDKDTYYPVAFKFGEQNMINHLKIYRSYHEAGPNELSLTHKGGLLLEFDVNYGGWGGQNYGWKIANHQYQYHTTFANANHDMWWMGFVVWLRGGGFVYHYESEKPANLQVAYSTTETIYYNASYPQYTVYAPAPLSAVNTTNIAAHSLATKSGIPLNPWSLAGNTLSYTGGAVAIGTTNPKSYKFAVGGTAVAEKVKVSKQTSWSDFVFETDYPLMQLDSVSQYIQTNKHLPHIPSAHQVATEGYDLGDMDALLLRKIEELTLYIIQQDKKIESMSTQLGSRKKRWLKLMSGNLASKTCLTPQRWWNHRRAGTINTSAANNYVARLSGYFCAPGTGGYNFTLVGTKGRLYMSPNEDPRGKKLVLNNDQGGGWDNSHKAWNVALTEKRSYYYELLLLDTGDWDYQKMMVDGPGIYNGTNGASMQYFSSIPRDTKPKKVRSDAVACGLMPPAPSLSDDMPNLFVGDTIVAADFKVIVDAVSGANGTFSGNGHANVKYLLDTPIKVRFDGIQVNDYYELVSGEITTEYDKDWGNVVDVDTVLNDFVKEVKSVADAAKTFIETKWEQVTSAGFTDFANEFKEKLAEEYDASTAAAYDAVLACAQGHINTINNNKRQCENVPPDATACNNITNATTGLNVCKSTFNTLETQRTTKLDQAVLVIKQALELLYSENSASNSGERAMLQSKLQLVSNGESLPTAKELNVAIDLAEVFDFGTSATISDATTTKLSAYLTTEYKYNKVMTGLLFSNYNKNNSSKHKEIAEELISKDGSKLSKYILDKLNGGTTIPAGLVPEVKEIIVNQLVEILMKEEIYKGK